MRRTLLPLALAIAVFLPIAPAPKTTLIFTLPGHHIGEYVASRDGNRIYYERDSAEVYLYDRRTRAHTRLFAANIFDLDVSARGDRLVFIKKAEDSEASHVWTIALDPTTGRSTGDPRRVSLTAAINASLSPDGRSVAFVTGERGEPNELVIAPAAGGPERVVAAKQGAIWPVRWTPDGKWIYYGSSEPTTKPGAVNATMRVAVDGGKPERVLNTADWGSYPGLSPDGRSLLTYSTNWDTIVVSTAAGRRVSEYWPLAGTPTPDLWIDGTHAIGSTNIAPSQLHVMNLTDGRKRFVSDSTLGLIGGRWSPDGSRIAAMPGLRGFKGIAMIDDAGRMTRVATHDDVNLNAGLVWSPDGQRIAYRPRGSSTSSFSVLDLATGREQSFAARAWSAMPLAWTANGRSVIYAVVDTATGSDSPTVHFHEATLNGSDRVLRTVQSKCAIQRPFCYKLLNDSTIVGYAASEYHLLNLRNAARDTLLLGRSTPQAVPLVSANNRWIAIRERLADGSWVINVLSSDGATRRRVALPAPPNSGPTNPWVSNDGSELVFTAQPQGAGTESVVYRVNVITGAATKIATIPFSLRGTDRGVSPDGKSILYGDHLERRGSIYEFDLSTLLRATP